MQSILARLAARVGHARAKTILIAAGLIIGVTLAVSEAWFLAHTRTAVIADAVREMRNDALMLADQEDRLLQSVDVVQLSLIEHLRAIGVDTPAKFEQVMSSYDVHRDLLERIAGLSQIGAMSVHDGYGRLINISLAWPPPSIDSAGRDFIRAVSAPGSPSTYISEPSRGLAAGHWTIFLSRRYAQPDGTLIGVVVTAINMEYFEQFYSRLPLTGGGSYTLFRTDGVLLARYPHVDPKIGNSYASTASFKRILAAGDGGVVRVSSQLDRQDRLVVPFAMAHFPLMVTVGDTVNSILAPWRQLTHQLLEITCLFAVVLAGGIVLAIRHLRAYERLQAAEVELALAEQREQTARALRLQGQRLDIALNNMLQGLIMFGHESEVLIVNRRFHELYGLAEGTITPGLSYQELTERVVACGNVTADDMAMVRERRQTLRETKGRAVVTWELTDGRAFTVTHQPMEEGWLTTYEEITDRREAEARMAYLAHHDALTGLPNRALFHIKLGKALAYARRGGILALLCLDLDQFKTVNDTLGHPVGDALLRTVAERLAKYTRETDTVARLGGDEFAIVMTPIEKPTDATGLAGRLNELLLAPCDIEGHQIVIGTSIGIALAPQDGMDPDVLLRSADLALYRAKTDGRGVYRLFHAEMDAQMQVRRKLELDLREALRLGQFELFYQPQVDVRLGEVTGAEALLRWRHPERGLVSPADFIPLAEEIGLIVPLGEWVLREACVAVAAWPSSIRVAVNLSPAQFKSRNLLAAVERALHEANLAPDRLEIEITETVMLHETDATLAILHRLRALGVRVAMDDFGTGYSSLSYLRRFPFDRIKIDQSFVRDLCSKPDCGAIVRAVAALSQELGIATTAEGVETSEQLAVLTSAGCTEIQGYLFSPAVPRDDLPRLFDRIGKMLRSPAGQRAPEPVG